MRGKHYYMAVTDDKYELPLIVADSVKEIAEYCGVKTRTVITSMSSGKGRYRKVPIGELEDGGHSCEAYEEVLK